MSGILDDAFAAVAQAAPTDGQSGDVALAPASGTEATPDPISDLASRLGGLSPEDRRRLVASAAADVLDAEANSRASKTLSRRNSELEQAQQRSSQLEQALLVLQDDYDATVSTAKSEAQRVVRESALTDPQLVGAAQQQWLAHQAQVARNHDFWRDVPAEAWQVADAQENVAEAFATLAKAVVSKGYVPKSEVQRQVNDALARERTRLAGGLPGTDTSRSEAPSSSDDVVSQLSAVNAAIRARGGNPTRDQMNLLESLTSRLQGAA